MSKSKIKQTINKSVEGVLNLDGDNITIEIEETGEMDFIRLFSGFNGQYVKITVVNSETE